MPLHTHTCLTAACDVCDQPITTGGHLICPTVDADHQAAMDELMPPEPQTVPDEQGELWPEGGVR